ncbi:MAG: RNA polymerase sigma factor [Candidatus Chloroheliales bacterium]|nr:MAG: RNA polymerase sigma factor [Chloroflexota bacterium]
MEAIEQFERTNEDWLGCLHEPGDRREAALADLRRLIIAGLPYALASWLSATDPHFAALAEDIAQETLLRVLDSLDTFAGRSRFTTWAQKIAVNLAISELRKRRWQDVSLEQLVADGMQISAASTSDPQITAEQRVMLIMVGRMMNEELTERQRLALIATMVKGMPLEEAARRLDTNRNALYKLLHDARLRLKSRIALEGLTIEEILASFG